MLETDPDYVRTDPSLPGLSIVDDEWRIDLEYYRPFIEATTGLAVPDDLENTDCYRIGNRLEAFIAERRRDDEWDEEVVESSPVVESLEEIVWVARFFRTCDDCTPHRNVSLND